MLQWCQSPNLNINYNIIFLYDPLWYIFKPCLLHCFANQQSQAVPYVVNIWIFKSLWNGATSFQSHLSQDLSLMSKSLSQRFRGYIIPHATIILKHGTWHTWNIPFNALTHTLTHSHSNTNTQHNSRNTQKHISPMNPRSSGSKWNMNNSPAVP